MRYGSVCSGVEAATLAWQPLGWEAKFYAEVEPFPSAAIAENVIGRQVENGGNGIGAKEEVAYTQNCTGVMGVCQNATVRRLLPVECEKLMGFPDNHTRIPWKGKPEEECPDAPRYKACGNSMCVNVMAWIGHRIDELEKVASVEATFNDSNNKELYAGNN